MLAMLWRSVPNDILLSRATQHLGGRKPFMHICSLLPTPQQLHTNVSTMGSTLGHCQGRLRPYQRARRARSPAMPGLGGARRTDPGLIPDGRCAHQSCDFSKSSSSMSECEPVFLDADVQGSAWGASLVVAPDVGLRKSHTRAA